MIIQKLRQGQLTNIREVKLNNFANTITTFTGKKELLQDLIDIASKAQKTSIIENSSPAKKIELMLNGKTYTILSREIEKFKNFFSYNKQTSIIHELNIFENGKITKTSKLNSDEFKINFDKLKEIVIPQVLKQIDTSITSPTDLLKMIGKGLLNGNIKTGESLVAQGANQYLQVGKIFQLPNKSTVSLKHYFRGNFIEDVNSPPEINLFLNNFEKNEFIISKKQDRELFSNTLKLDMLIESKQENIVKLETLKNEAEIINQKLDDFQNNFETNTNETNKQIESFKGTFII